MMMLVLSPSVEAMKASAFSIPAATSASVSRPAPTVNWPPRSSQPFSSPTSSRACDSGSSSRQETSWPSLSIARATEDPTRPHPTIKMNTRRILDVGCLGGRRQQHPAGGFLQHVLGRGADLGWLGGADAAELGAALDLRRWLAADHYRLRVEAARGLDDAGADAARTHYFARHLDVLVLLADVACPGQGAQCLGLNFGRQLGVERERERDLDHVNEVEPCRVDLSPRFLALGGGEAPGRGDDVIVELGPEDGDEDVAEGDFLDLLGQRLLGD